MPTPHLSWQQKHKWEIILKIASQVRSLHSYSAVLSFALSYGCEFPEVVVMHKSPRVFRLASSLRRTHCWLYSPKISMLH